MNEGYEGKALPKGIERHGNFTMLAPRNETVAKVEDCP